MTESQQDRMTRAVDETNAWMAKNIADGGVCDFCCAELTGKPVVTYTTSGPIADVMLGISGVGVGVIEQINDEYWAACPDCDPVIQAGDPVKLAEHVVANANYDRIEVERDPSDTAMLLVLYRQFFALNPVRGDNPPPYVNDPSDPRGDAA